VTETDARPIPRATYRLQFHKGFGFGDAGSLAPYLAKHSGLFAQGDMSPSRNRAQSRPYLCFGRSHQEDVLLVAAARFPLQLEADPDWSDTEIPCPKTRFAGARWRNLLVNQH
jgi:maltooligosyltrehalose synthase